MDPKKATTRGLKLYRSYNFRDKDPVIDALRTAFEDAGHTYQYVHEQSDVSTSTIANWFHGKTRRPTVASIAAVGTVLGYRSYDWVDRKLVGRTRPALKLIKGSKGRFAK